MELHADDVTCALLPERGGRIASLRVGDFEVLQRSEDNPKDFGMFVMAPWAGRTRDGVFAFRGVGHHLPANSPPHAIHGTVRDHPWVVEESSERRVRMTGELGADWPFAGWCEHIVSVHVDRLECELSVYASDGDLPASLGWHPWFRKPDALDLRARTMYDRDGDIVVRTTHAPTPGPWDDCFTDLEQAPELRWADGFSLRVESTCRCVVVYDEQAHATCVEPQTAPPNALNEGDATIVSPGDPLRARMTWRWTR